MQNEELNERAQGGGLRIEMSGLGGLEFELPRDLPGEKGGCPKLQREEGRQPLLTVINTCTLGESYCRLNDGNVLSYTQCGRFREHRFGTKGGYFVRAAIAFGS